MAQWSEYGLNGGQVINEVLTLFNLTMDSISPQTHPVVISTVSEYIKKQTFLSTEASTQKQLVSLGCYAIECSICLKLTLDIQCPFSQNADSGTKEWRWELPVLVSHISIKYSEDLEILISKVEQFLPGNIVIVPLN